MSSGACHMSVFLGEGEDKVVKLVVENLLSTGPTPSSLMYVASLTSLGEKLSNVSPSTNSSHIAIKL